MRLCADHVHVSEESAGEHPFERAFDHPAPPSRRQPAVVAATCGSPPTVVPPPNPGTVSLTVSTTGSDLDQNGYTVALDDGSPQNVSPNGSVTFSGLQPGAHTSPSATWPPTVRQVLPIR